MPTKSYFGKQISNGGRLNGSASPSGVSVCGHFRGKRRIFLRSPRLLQADPPNRRLPSVCRNADRMDRYDAHDTRFTPTTCAAMAPIDKQLALASCCKQIFDKILASERFVDGRCATNRIPTGPKRVRDDTKNANSC